MRQTYAFEIIQTFSPEETEAFRQFLNSPYFNNGFQSEQHKTLFRLLNELRHNPDSEYERKDCIYEHLFPNSPIVIGKLDKLLSEFKKLLHVFLCTQRYLNSDNTNNQMLDLAVELRQRNLIDRGSQILRRVRQRAEQPKPESRNDYQFRLQLAFEEHEQFSTLNKAAGDLNIPDLIGHLDRYYYVNRLELLNRLLMQSKIVQLPLQAAALTTEPWSVPENCLSFGNAFRIPWKIRTILLSETPSVADFEAVRDLLHTQESGIDSELLKEYYTYLRNICTDLVDGKGHVELAPVLFQVQRDNLGRGYFYHHGKIPAHSILNITQWAVRLKELSWANDFVEQHKDIIIGEYETRDLYRVSKALCLFGEKQYTAALDIIPFGTSYSYFHLIARRTELKIYYELDSDLLPYKIDAFKKFIQRAGKKQMPRKIYEMNLHFINILQQLSTSPKTNARTRSDQLIRRIESKKSIGERFWLLEKATELGKKSG